jgi:hypothetical protein
VCLCVTEMWRNSRIMLEMTVVSPGDGIFKTQDGDGKEMSEMMSLDGPAECLQSQRRVCTVDNASTSQVYSC